MGDFNSVGAAFAQQYYAYFATDRAQLGGIYRDTSLMTYSGTQLYGTQAIMEYLTQTITMRSAQILPMEQYFQPTATGGVMAVITGEVKADQEEHSLTFLDVFHLALDEGGNFYVANQFSRILGGGSV